MEESASSFDFSKGARSSGFGNSGLGPSGFGNRESGSQLSFAVSVLDSGIRRNNSALFMDVNNDSGVMKRFQGNGFKYG
jgi:hypothetical protein